MGSGHGKTSTRGSKDSGPARVRPESADSRAARCRSIAGCPSADSRTSSRSTTPLSTSESWRSWRGKAFNADRLFELASSEAGDGLKILGTGQLTRKITVEAHHFSKSAVDKIEKAGGAAKVIGASE